MKRHTFMSDGYYVISGRENFDDQNEDYCGAAIDKLAEYENLEEQGRLVILPCKVGDSYFTYSWGCHGSHNDCFEYDCDECPHLKREIRECKFKNVVHILNAEKDFGKSIFLTREEIEAAIKGE